MKIYAEPHEKNKARIKIFRIKSIVAMILSVIAGVFSIWLFSRDIKKSFIVFLAVLLIALIYISIEKKRLMKKYLQSCTVWVYYNDRLYMVYEETVKKKILFWGKNTVYHELAMNIFFDSQILKKMFDTDKPYGGMSFYLVDKIYHLEKRKKGAVFYLDDGRQIMISNGISNYNDLICNMEKINNIERKIHKIMIDL